MDRQERHAFLETLSDFALYETFYETGTIYGGTLVALEDKAEEEHDTDRFHTWRGEEIRLQHDRNNVAAHDRDSQIRFIEQWNDRREELEAILEH
ncbi:hypothetical protein [Bifidobacterium sp. SO1]|uniref:hypothetical protein n=1 Tax=Bifidobacterium sp. SO1 TaxID=2809029 RepID=UPI001BDD8F7E|nr:hypothetical protein [Bifidobacterium sp. SO1]MBT1162827.1 hypothetical protein [Bifidobacterium sp. SO1]